MQEASADRPIGSPKADGPKTAETSERVVTDEHAGISQQQPPPRPSSSHPSSPTTGEAVDSSGRNAAVAARSDADDGDSEMAPPPPVQDEMIAGATIPGPAAEGVEPPLEDDDNHSGLGDRMEVDHHGT
jgi:hypothetical protein